MSEHEQSNKEFDDLPFHEYCAYCNERFDGTILDPTVTIFETDDERVLYSFCDEECLSSWVSEE